MGRARGRSPRRGLFQVLERDEEATRAGGRNLVGREFERVDSRFFGGEQAVVDLHYQFGGGAAVGEVHEGVGQVAGVQRVAAPLDVPRSSVTVYWSSGRAVKKLKLRVLCKKLYLSVWVAEESVHDGSSLHDTAAEAARRPAARRGRIWSFIV